MDREDIIERFASFLRNYADDRGNEVYINKLKDLLTVIPKRSLTIDWTHLNSYDPELAEELLNNPEEAIEAAEDAIQIVLREPPIEKKEEFKVHARFYNLPKTLLVKELGSEHINRFIQVDGIVTRVSEVKPFVQKAVFVCKDCGNEMIRLQKPYENLIKPARCDACGSRNIDLDVEKSRFINFQSFRLQDRPESLKGGQMPRFVDAILLDDMVDSALPGDRVLITGVLRVILEQKDKKPIFKKVLEVNHIEQLSKEIEELDISPEDEQKIRELARRKDVIETIVDSIAPAIWGMKDVKMGIALALFGGVQRILPDGTKLRGESHVLLVGDPGVAKCVDYHTKVLLADGSLREIGRIIEKAIEKAEANETLGRVDDGFYAPIELELYALDAKTLKVRKVKANIAWKRKAPDRMFRIKTASGREIRVTPTHPFFTFENGQFRTRKAEELRVGDFIATPRRDNEPRIVPKTEDEGLKKLLEESDIFWDRIVEIEEYTPEHEWVYDLQVPEHHNFIANDIFVHNSQLLRYVANLAPRAIYTSGKSSSAAGLCVAPDSVIETNMGRFEIGSLVDRVIPEDVTEYKSVDAEPLGLTVKTKEGARRVLRLWKLKAPEKLVRIRAKDGREIVVTPETRLLTPEGWKQAKDITDQVLTDNGVVRVTTEIISSPYDHVYDLTVEGSHSFIANGFVVHNTAAAVRDEFTGSWVLEAGVLVLADGGFACLHPDSRVLVNGKYVRIEDLFESEKSYKALSDGQVVDIQEKEMEVTALDLTNMKTKASKATIIRRKPWKGELLRLKFRSGNEVTLTPDHLLIDGQTLEWKEAEKFKVGESVIGLDENFSPRPDEITSIERVPYDGYVYDLYVPGEHNFLAEGIVVHNCIDEFDKMSDRDRSAIHEALEQQSYHHDFELLLADGRKVKIGELVDSLIEANRDRVILGKDTEILPVDDIELLAYDLEKKEVIKVKADRVSRHKAPEKFIRLRFSNGREITVTPEHPIMVWENGEIREKPAEKVTVDDMVLGVSKYPIELQPPDDKVLKDKKSAWARQDYLYSLGIVSRIRKGSAGYEVLTAERTFPGELLRTLRDAGKELRFKLSKWYHARKPLVSENLLREEIERLRNHIKYVLEIAEKEPLEALNYLIKSKVASKYGLTAQTLTQWVARGEPLALSIVRDEIKAATERIEKAIKSVEDLLNANINFLKINEVEEIPNDRWEWVYDVTVEPHHLFVSHGLVLHNTISISKAGITATLNARTTVIAAANPKYGRFNRHKSLPEQLDLPPTLLSRFDLIFLLLDEPDEKLDSNIAEHILKVRRGEAEAVTPKIPHDLLKKYIAYARKNIHPVLSREAMEEIKRYYVRMRKGFRRSSDDEGVQPIPITARQLEALIRLSEAHARMRLSETVTREDARAAIRLVEDMIKKIAVDEEGTLDVSILEVGTSSRKINKIDRLVSIVKALEDEGEYGAPVDRILEEAAKQGINKAEARRLLEELSAKSRIYEPRAGFYRVLG
ncbi:MAG: DNA replication protein [Thermococcus sp.]|nr:DNA replication protein [Thermococcus sp.]